MITAKIIADTFNPAQQTRLTTFELEYPRFIHAELMTHRMLSKNCASSRAIPVTAMIDNVISNTAFPIHWGQNKAGMQADTEILNQLDAKVLWVEARDNAIASAIKMNKLGLHKQVVNRVLEPFQMMKTIITGTEWANFFWLRNHEAAQPEIAKLASLMHDAMNASTPSYNYYHLPYINQEDMGDGSVKYTNADGLDLSLADAIKVSVSCCAQVSYRKNDGGLEKALKIYDMLGFASDNPETRVHASPAEHIGWRVNIKNSSDCDLKYRNGFASYWSGNFNGFVQLRQTMRGESV